MARVELVEEPEPPFGEGEQKRLIGLAPRDFRSAAVLAAVVQQMPFEQCPFDRRKFIDLPQQRPAADRTKTSPPRER